MQLRTIRDSELFCDEAPPSEISEQIIQQKEIYRVPHREPNNLYFESHSAEPFKRLAGGISGSERAGESPNRLTLLWRGPWATVRESLPCSLGRSLRR